MKRATRAELVAALRELVKEVSAFHLQSVSLNFLEARRNAEVLLHAELPQRPRRSTRRAS